MPGPNITVKRPAQSLPKTPKVPGPHSVVGGVPRTLGLHAPRIKPLQTRIYNKQVTKQDPGSFANSGFGPMGNFEGSE